MLYTAVQIPYQAAFPANTVDSKGKRKIIIHQTSSTHYIGYAVDAMFLLDIFINFLTTYPKSETEEIVMNHRKIAIHYLKTWFTVDFIAVIPFDWIVASIQTKSEEVSTH